MNVSNQLEVYVGTTVESGKLQYDFLRDLGMRKDDFVLEIGHGALHASRYVIDFLEEGHFSGIDPNDWLWLESSKKDDQLRRILDEKKPIFLQNLEFDAKELGIKFQFVLSHSVLSHAAHWQLPLFLLNASACLAPGGLILASLRLSEGNSYGSDGFQNSEDSMSEQWVYPGNSYFSKSSIQAESKKLGLSIQFREDFTKRLTDFRSSEFHDWVVFTKN